MLKIKLIDRITNEELLKRIREKRTWRREEMIAGTGGLLRDILEGDVKKRNWKGIKIFFPVNEGYG